MLGITILVMAFIFLAVDALFWGMALKDNAIEEIPKGFFVVLVFPLLFAIFDLILGILALTKFKNVIEIKDNNVIIKNYNKKITIPFKDIKEVKFVKNVAQTSQFRHKAAVLNSGVLLFSLNNGEMIHAKEVTNVEGASNIIKKQISKYKEFGLDF